MYFCTIQTFFKKTLLPSQKLKKYFLEIFLILTLIIEKKKLLDYQKAQKPTYKFIVNFVVNKNNLNLKIYF